MIQEVVLSIWQTYQEAALYILFGLFLSGILRAFITTEKITHYLGKNNFRSVWLAAIFGVPLPLCSCGVIPAAVALRKSGASKGATMAFLISTPETGVDSIALSYALLDPVMAIFRPVAALLSALCAGFLEMFFNKNDDLSADKSSEKSCCASKPSVVESGNISQRILEGLQFAFNNLLMDIAPWFLMGIVVSGIISYFVPPTFVENYLGQGWQAMALALLLGIPMYICASATTPIAASLILKGMSPGVALVFLLAGPATNAATILTVARFLGMRSVIVYLLSIAGCAVLAGVVLNYIYQFWGINAMATVGHAHDHIPSVLKLIASGVLLALMVNVFVRWVVKSN